jgi:hypothetical protein
MNTQSIALAGGVFLTAFCHLSLADIQPVSVADTALAASVSGNGFSTTPEMSPDGRFVVFSSFANNLAANDDNYWMDVFLRDRQSGTTTLISANTNGLSGNGYSGSPSLSANGAWIAFESDATDLAPGDTKRTTDVFVRNTTLGLTTLVSVNTNGTSANHASTFPIITPDGRFVAFESTATDLVTNNVGTNVINIYLRDLSSNTTVLASVSTNGIDGGNADSKLAGVSPDGRYVLFTSALRYLYSPINTLSDVFLRDLQTQQTYWVSSNMVQSLGTNVAFSNPAMSGDGQHIVFRAQKWVSMTRLVVRYDLSSDTSLVISSNATASYIDKWDYPGPTISQDGSVVAYMDFTTAISPSYFSIKQIYVWDAASNTNVLVSVASDGSTAGNADSISPVLSADGRTLAFLSQATNLVDNTPASSRGRIYIRNLVAGVTKLASSKINLGKPQNDDVEDPVLSADGSLVAFSSLSDGLVDHDDNDAEDVFVSDVQTGVTELISSKSSTIDSLTPYASSFMPANGISGDGRFVVFSTSANNLAAGDANLQRDVYVRDLVTGKIQLVSVNADGTGAGNGVSMQPSISADGKLVTFQSTSSDLVTGDTNGLTDVFIRDTATGQTRLVSAAFGSSGSARGNSVDPIISPNGHFVLFRSNAVNLTNNIGSSRSRVGEFER